MSAFVGTLLSLLLLYKYALLFVAVFSSAIVLPVPVNSLLLAAGAFASQGYLSFWLSFIVVLGANTLGDAIDYVLAARYGEIVMRKLHIPQVSYLTAVEKLVRRHPGPTIFFTRFTNTLDPVVNILSGLVGVPFLTFLLYDVLGNLVSLGAVLILGYVVGSYWMMVSGFVTTFGWIVSAFLLLCAIIIIFGKRIGLHRLPPFKWARRWLKDLEELE